MSYSDQLLQGTMLTEQSMLQDLETLQHHYEAMGLTARVLPSSQAAPMPSLVAVAEAEDVDPLMLTHSFLPLDSESAEFTKYLQFYCELPGSLEKVDRLTLLECVNRLNQTLPYGTALLVEPRPELELPLMAAVRSVQGFQLELPIDQAVFTEDAILFQLSCHMVAFVMEALREGRTVDEAFAQLDQ